MKITSSFFISATTFVNAYEQTSLTRKGKRRSQVSISLIVTTVIFLTWVNQVDNSVNELGNTKELLAYMKIIAP